MIVHLFLIGVTISIGVGFAYYLQEGFPEPHNDNRLIPTLNCYIRDSRMKNKNYQKPCITSIRLLLENFVAASADAGGDVPDMPWGSQEQGGYYSENWNIEKEETDFWK